MGRNILTILLMSISIVSLSSAQKAKDFKANDTKGDFYHLYEILKAGKYVFLDFFCAT